MKLSDAIRLGAMMGPQARQLFVPQTEGTCVIGAALLGIGKLDKHREENNDVFGIWPWADVEVMCPDCGGQTSGAAMVHLNDRHRWTREAIADWVATIEPEEVHASETIREVQSGLRPKRSTPEVETFETITK